MILRLAAMFLLAGSYAFGQSSVSLITLLSSPDSILAQGQSELDSVRNAAAAQFAAIRTSYDSVLAAADEHTVWVNAGIDSLEKLNMPLASLSAKLDSIRQWKDKRINALNEKVEKLKAEVATKIKSLELPPDLMEKGEELTSIVNELDASIPEAGMPVALKELQLDVPGLENPLGDQNIPGLENIGLKEVNLGETGAQITQYQDQLPDLPASIDEASSLAEEQAMKIADVNEISDQLGEAASVTEMASLPDEQAVKEELVVL